MLLGLDQKDIGVDNVLRHNNATRNVVGCGHCDVISVLGLVSHLQLDVVEMQQSRIAKAALPCLTQDCLPQRIQKRYHLQAGACLRQGCLLVESERAPALRGQHGQLFKHVLCS